MKLVRFDSEKTGLMVQFASGPHVIDVIGFLGALSPGDPISQGILNGILKNKRSWAPLIEDWNQARIRLRRLTSLALANPDRPDLVICRADQVGLAALLRNPGGIVILDIVESSEVAQDPTGREAMERQFGGANTQADSIFPYEYVHRHSAEKTLFLALYIEPGWLADAERNFVSCSEAGFFPQGCGVRSCQARP
jgi:hypothetical protein